MNNHPPNHPLYNTLGNPPNILLDSMFTMQPAAEHAAIHKPTLIPTQYAYPDMQALSGHPHHAVNLAQSHATATVAVNEAPTQVLIYQNPDQQQQHPISYKIPQMEASVAPPINVPTPPVVSHHLQVQGRAQVATAVSNVDKKKDIVAEAASKIFEDVGGKKAVPATQSAAASSTSLPTAIKSEPGTTPASTSGMNPATSCGPNAIKSAPIVTPRAGPVSRGRGAGRPANRQQIMPRIHLLDDEDDGVTCRMCLHSFWYKSQLHEHLKSSHSISDPERYEREEREKKLRRIREEQQRHIMAKRQRMGGSGSRSSGGGARRGMPIGRPGRPIAGPRPSFQYRDGAFICDLCKKSFSDGNDMVSHWKSHVKKQRMEGGYRGRGRPAINPSGKRGPGRPPKDGYGRVIRKDYISASGRPITGQSAGRGRGRGRGRGGRSDKGKPRWTSYLVWSTRRRKEIADEGEGFSFAEVAKQISAEWKEVGEEEKEKLQDEAEEMNACGQRKLETTVGSSESESSTSDSDIDTDPEFEEEGEGEKKPIMLKIKREDGTEEEVPAPKKPRSSRERKRPSFFQEFENEENNLDKILDDFELEQIEESKQPKPEKKAGNPTGAGRPRGKRRKRTPSPEAPQEPIELEKSRSGRVRKKPKFQAYFKGEGEEDEVTEIGEESEDDGEFKPDESDEAEEENEEELEEELEEEEVEEEEIDENGVKTIRKIALPPKKRSSLSKKILTDGEIEEATKAAMSAKSTVENEDQDNNSAAGTDAPGISKESESTDNKAPGSNEGVTENNTVESGVANPSADGDASEKPSQEAFDSEVTMEEEPHKEGANEVDEEPVTEQNTVEVASGEQEKEQVDATEVSSAQDVAPENTTELAQSTSETAPIEMSVTSETVESAETPVENATTEPPAPAVDTTSEEDLLASTASSKMEEGDDKFKDIIAESQMDNIFN